MEAGAHVLVHSVFDKPVDEPFMPFLKENDVLYTPPSWWVSYRETFAQQLDFTTAEHRIGQKDVIASLFDLRTLPDSLLMDGRTSLRDPYASSSPPPRLHVDVAHTAPMGDTVVLHEVIAGGASGGPNEQVVLYRMAGGPIEAVWLGATEWASRGRNRPQRRFLRRRHGTRVM